MPRWLHFARALNGVGQTNTDMVDSTCFSLYFQDAASEKTPIQRQCLDITRLENESVANLERSGRMPSMNRLRKKRSEGGQNNETRQRSMAFPLSTFFFFFFTSQDNLCPDTVICLLHLLDQHITHSWLWLKQKALILSGY